MFVSVVALVSVVSVVSFRPFRFVVSGFSTCPNDSHSQREHTEIHNLSFLEPSDSRKYVCVRRLDSVRIAIHFFVILTFSNGCILLTFGSIYTKLGDFAKLRLHFMTMWINSC